MNSLPLVGVEVQRINVSFSAISQELTAAISGLRDAQVAGVGNPSADAAVAAGMADLLAVLDRLRAGSDACTTALRRHAVDDATPDPFEAAVPPEEGE